MRAPNSSRWLMVTIQVTLLELELRRRSIFRKPRSRLPLLSCPCSWLRVTGLSLWLALSPLIVVEWCPLWFQCRHHVVAIVLSEVCLPSFCCGDEIHPGLFP